MRSVLVIGTGLMGTSVALALRARDVRVHLRDVDSTALRTAAALGAGTVAAPTEPVDLAVMAVPPPLVGRVLADVQAEGVARHYTDVASVKGEPWEEAEALGCDTARYIGGHPMAGASRSGPLTARADLFEGCAWVLTPTADTGNDTLNSALELVALCGAVPVLMRAAAHDRAVALVSHAPHVVASLVAMRLEDADDRAVSLAGPGLRDLTRIAEADPGLWTAILSANAQVVADLLDDLGEDLRQMVDGLRAIASADEAKGRAGAETVEGMLRRGRAGRTRIPGKHGSGPERFEAVSVLIGDQPGELARLFADVGRAGVNIEDIRIEHATSKLAGLVHLSVATGLTTLLKKALQARGWQHR
ncbi:prephenate dehydrogenase [Streptomyces sp. NBC_00536]|uniref:prephenate dehydrogenase n=1 Tax=Streptomyces sp. NBC_00536 TaxID=2975769 RepID=UPI002E7FF11A|nr:prephenate dehydrogenase [Streptomyces sp. NBC_00536]WUC81851.1 prephenate dehydrogenase [Streptomyces sp. NBC_00536]